jgi:Ni/Fe-hydrogenase 1 B-type cytochrome subunit
METTAAAGPRVQGVRDLVGDEKKRFPVSVFVYEWPVRVWHWVTALAVLVLCVTGYFIGAPPPTLPGEASDHFLFGYLRTAHFTSGYILAIGLVIRTYWAFVGNRHARDIYVIPVTSAKFWSDLVAQVRWYLLVDREPRKHTGHNPLARLWMFLLFINPAVFMSVTGLALFGEGAGIQSWQYRVFGWVFQVFGSSMAVHTWHHVGMWVIVVFAMMHIYPAIREDVMGRTSILSTMVSGWRTFRDDRD